MMIKAGSDILFQEPMCDTRRLRRSVVVAASDTSFSIQFVAEPFEFDADQEVLFYFNGKREFLQQVGRIEEVVEPSGDAAVSEEESAEESALNGDAITFTIVPVGDAISAESRQNYRVSTLAANLEARVGTEQGVPVQDLSATGFAVVASESYDLGQAVEVGIKHNDEECHGTAVIQSVREFGPGRIRYGMRAIEGDPHTSVFLATLQRISLAVQREQLQRS
ncbi:MAG: PilZ domain-containing protein [Myxococcota bacterium]